MMGISILMCFFATAVARAQISPGPLSRAHKQLSGLTHCVDCHSARKKEFTCLNCHKEIDSRLAAQRGFHASTVSRTAPNRDCRRCHAEHKGEDTPLIRWQPSLTAFDHSKTGYVLEGKHGTLTCNRCHTPEHIAAADLKDIQVKDAKRTFLGLQRQCLTCHQDQHRGQLSQDCRQCHSFSEWKRPPGFDHDKAKFRRTGAHVHVTCQKCHQAGANGTIQYTNLAFSRCNDCHRDPHRGAFPNACDSCHNTGAWKNTNLADKFSHTQTKFRLLGKHATIECVKCHAGGDFKKPLSFAKCTDCHKPDPHSGQFAKRADRGECSACHIVEGFKPVQFGVREHDTTAFVLQGKHITVQCAKCHVPAGKATLYRIKFASCTDCHKDAHQQQFSGAPHFNRCDDCHTVQGFRPSTFVVARHETASFALSGAHLKVDCAKCHKVDVGQKVPVRYRFGDRSCAACHDDPHRGRFRQQLAEVGTDGSMAGCLSCHTPQSWKEVRFAHTVNKFPLVGKHRTIACGKCHTPPRPEVPLKDVDFSLAPTRCEKCHQESHAGQFARADGTAPCAECHNSVRWVPSLFNHNRPTAYPLAGKHREVKCVGCHKNVKIVQGKPVLFFKPTPRQCTACHREPV